MVDATIAEKLNRFVEAARRRFPVKQMVLFGSYARGTAGTDSDIDVAVVLKDLPDDILAAEAELYRLRRDIDSRIEPVLADDQRDPSGFWSEVCRTGTVIYQDT